MIYYKWLRPDRTTTYQGTLWPVRAGMWTPDKRPVLCESGWHLATLEGVGQHARVGAELWTAEGRGESDKDEDKVAFTSARILKKAGTLVHLTAVTWAADCAKRPDSPPLAIIAPGPAANVAPAAYAAERRWQSEHLIELLQEES